MEQHFAITNDQRLREYVQAVRGEAYRDGRSEGYRIGRKDMRAELAPEHREGRPVTAWSIGLEDDNTISIMLDGARIGVEDACQIAATLWDRATTLRNRLQFQNRKAAGK